MTAKPATGGIHPIMAGPSDPWVFGADLIAWRQQDGSVVLQGEDGDVTIPLGVLILLGRGLLAAAVTGQRPEWKQPGA